MKRMVLILALIAAPAFAQVTADTPNPLDGKTDAIEAGQGLFGKMNCAGCHAYDLTGGMGPDLTDPSWQYGSKPGEVYHTIAEGTLRGMPAWKDKLTADEIWQLVAYIHSRKQ
ncbi:MAG: c-type cytochrome [Alphaproteobacteria bacterium]